MFGQKAGKRFEFARNSEGKVEERSRLIRTSIQEAAGETMEKYPYVAGFSMFGSRTKGREKAKSDADIVLFLDFDKSGLQKKGEEIPFAFFRRRLAEVMKGKGLTDAEAKRVLGPDAKTMLHALSKEYIRDTVADGIAYKRNEARGADKANAKGAYQDIVTAPGAPIPALFHMDVGGGLRPWRRQVIEELEKAGETGEALWRELMEAMRFAHDDPRKIIGKRLSPKTSYPKTLADARRVFLNEQSEEMKQAA